MKKLLLVLAVGSFAVACNNEAATTEAKVDSAATSAAATIDSAASAVAATADTAVAKIDSTVKAVTDSIKK
jgi:hypothetical protein